MDGNTPSYTDSKIRYLKCVLVIMDIFPFIVSKLLEFSGPTPQIAYKIIQNDPAFKRRLTSTEHTTLQTLSTDGYTKLDLTLMFKIITYFKYIPSPTMGWKSTPTQNEITIGDDAQRLRLKRNQFTHTVETEVNETEFNEFFAETEFLCKRIDSHLKNSSENSFERKVAKIKSKPLIGPAEVQKRHTEERLLKEFFVKKIDKNEFNVCTVKSLKDLKETTRDNPDEQVHLTLTFHKLHVDLHNRNLRDLCGEINRNLANIKVEEIREGSLLMEISIPGAILLNDELLQKEVIELLATLSRLLFVEDATPFPVVNVVIAANEEIQIDDEYECGEDDDTIPSKGSIHLDLKVSKETFQSDERLQAELENLFGQLTLMSNGSRILPDDKPVVAVVQPRIYADRTNNEEQNDNQPTKLEAKSKPLDEHNAEQSVQTCRIEENTRWNGKSFTKIGTQPMVCVMSKFEVDDTDPTIDNTIASWSNFSLATRSHSERKESPLSSHSMMTSVGALYNPDVIVDNKPNEYNTSEKIIHNRLIVAAIDFGTTHSGYAFCTRDKYTKNPNDPDINSRAWINKANNNVTLKAPTCVLFDPDEKFDCFGYDAANKYRNNPGQLDLSKWYYFENFKMMLFKEKDRLSKDTILTETIDIKDEKLRKSMLAVDVFAAVIKYFKDDLLGKLKVITISEEDIQWVITVPAIWDLKARQFMRDAGAKAGIKLDQLVLVLEPEAASMYCRRTPVSVAEDEDGGKKIASMAVGTKYAVLDQGGGTTDIAVHEVTGKNTLKDIHQACGGYWGGITVNEEFFSFLTKLLGVDVINHVKSNAPSDYYEFLHNFERVKTSFTEEDAKNETDGLSLRIPVSWMIATEEITGCDLPSIIQHGRFNGKVKMKGDRMRIQNGLFRSFFDHSVNNVLRELESLLQKELKDVGTLLIVGGFSKSDILIGEIRKKLGNNCDIVIPKDPEVSVLKGAVLFGFNPEVITCRVSSYTYGIAMQRPFKPDVDLDVRKRLVNGLIDNVFDKHVEIGEVMKIGEFLPEHAYVPTEGENKCARFEFYATEKNDPLYVTDPGCSCIGVIDFELSENANRQDMTLKLIVSGKEVLAIITEKSSGKQSNAYFNFFECYGL